MSLMPSRGSALRSPMADATPLSASTAPARVVTEVVTVPVAASTTRSLPAAQATIAVPPAVVATTARATVATQTLHVGKPAAPIAHQSPVDAGSIGSAIFALVLVVGLILALGWIARRMPGMRGNRHGALRVVDSLTLGPRERVVVVAVGETQLLLGVGAGGTRMLHTLEHPLPALAANTNTPAFAQLLAQHFGKKQ